MQAGGGLDGEENARRGSSFDGRAGRGFIVGSPGSRKYFRTLFRASLQLLGDP